MGRNKQLKKIIQIQHKIVKSPSWLEGNQLTIYKRGPGFELGNTVQQIQIVVRAGLEPGTAGLRPFDIRPFSSLTIPLLIIRVSRIQKNTKRVTLNTGRVINHERDIK